MSLSVVCSFCSFVLKQDMRTIFIWCCLLAVLIEPCMSDMYMHFPPGSNNRLNGNQDNVRNANRLFDSQVGRCYTPISIHGVVNLHQAHHIRPQYEQDKICFVCNWWLLNFSLLSSACCVQEQFGHSNKIVIHSTPYLFQNNGKAGYNVGDKLDSNPGDNIQEFRQQPLVNNLYKVKLYY